MVKLDKGSLKVAWAASRDYPKLACVRITGTEVQATDGRIAVKVKHLEEDEELKPFCVGQTSFREAYKITTKSCQVDDDGGLVTHTGVTMNLRKVDDEFPDMDSVTPNGEPKFEFSLNAVLLKTLLEVIISTGKARNLHSKYPAMFTLKYHGPTQPVVLEGVRSEVVGLVMPITVNR